jgi:hypothetical protein
MEFLRRNLLLYETFGGSISSWRSIIRQTGLAVEDFAGSR